MIYIHKDIIYTQPLYKFIKRILDKKKISNTVIDAHDLDFVNSLDIKDDDVLIARFAHDKEDLIKTQKVFPTLTKKFKTMFPSEESYYYFDDKLKQYEFMIENDIPCLETHYVASKEEIEKLNMNFPIVTKKTWGAGAEQVNYFETLDCIVDDETTRSWTQDSIYPCLVQEYEDVNYDLRIVIIDKKVFVYKRIHKWKTGNKNNFPYGMPENPREKVLKYRYPPYQQYEQKICNDSELLDLVDLTTKLQKIQETKLNTKHMSWDIVNGKVLEFGYISTLCLVGRHYDLSKNKICDFKNNLNSIKHLEYLLMEYIK
jgi:hypothetical protein|tara:strand:- start:31 stop:975 length:945 start_codon:yes stop_codon:yes gene_type:complete